METLRLSVPRIRLGNAACHQRRHRHSLPISECNCDIAQESFTETTFLNVLSWKPTRFPRVIAVSSKHQTSQNAFSRELHAGFEMRMATNMLLWKIVSEDDFNKFNSEEKRKSLPPLRHLYDRVEQVMIVKLISGKYHHGPLATFDLELHDKLVSLGFRDALYPIGTTDHQGPRRNKQPDASYRPLNTRPRANDAPSFVIECGPSKP